MNSPQSMSLATVLARIVVLGFFVIPGVAMTADRAEAQRVVILQHEPRHRMVHDAGEMKVFDIQMLPGDTTLMHTHSYPIIYTFISSGNGPSDGRVSANVDYLTESYTHQAANPGDQLFRIIALEHYGSAAPSVTANRPDGMSGEPQLENAWFRSYRLELAPGEQTPVLMHHNPALIVQVSDGHTEVTKENGFGADLEEMGDWTWRDPHSSYRIRNAGSTPVSVVVNEGRQGY
ncbi:MAG: hypothetical protein WD766_00935 [Gemmatimonadota bacterium]